MFRCKIVIVLNKKTLRKERNLKQASSSSLIEGLLYSQCDSDYTTLSPLVPKRTPVPKGAFVLTFKTNSHQQKDKFFQPSVMIPSIHPLPPQSRVLNGNQLIEILIEILPCTHLYSWQNMKLQRSVSTFHAINIW